MFIAAPPIRPFSPPLLPYIALRPSFPSAVALPAAKLPNFVASSRPAHEAPPEPHETTGAATGIAAPGKINQSPLPSAAGDVSRGREPTSSVEGPLTGSVVLQALQRAVAKKEEKIKKKKGGKNWKAPLPSAAELASGINYEDVLPIEIRSDWAQRLDELEKRVHEFQARCN